MEDAAGQRFCIRSLDTYRVWTNKEKFEEQKAKTEPTKKIPQGTSLSLSFLIAPFRNAGFDVNSKTQDSVGAGRPPLASHAVLTS